MYSQLPLASDGFILNLIDVLLIFSKPFSNKFNEYHNQFPKINCLYLMTDEYFVGGSKIEKLDNDIVAMFNTNLILNP